MLKILVKSSSACLVNAPHISSFFLLTHKDFFHILSPEKSEFLSGNSKGDSLAGQTREVS
jgi:hypothetical protein